jgi:hypothetical protein
VGVCVCVRACVVTLAAQGYRASEDEWLDVWDERIAVPLKKKTEKMVVGTPLLVRWDEGDGEAYGAAVVRSSMKRVFVHYDVRACARRAARAPACNALLPARACRALTSRGMSGCQCRPIARARPAKRRRVADEN